MKNLVKTIAHNLPPQWYIAGRNWIEGDYEVEIKMLANALQGVGEPVLDIGCGSGEIAPNRLGLCITGLDLDTSLMHYARSRGYESLVCGHTAALPYRDNSLGGAILCKLGHHLNNRDLRRAVAETLRVLRPGGRMVILDPWPGSAATTLAHRIITRLEIGAFHRTLEQTLAQIHGFDILSTKNFRKKSYDFYIITCSKPGNSN